MDYQGQNSSTVHLFWTGGWDSTFRLLELLLVNNQTVQPHYIIDERRASLGHEMDSINSIRSHLLARYPIAKQNLFLVKFSTRQQVIPNNKTRAAFSAIAKYRHLGDQYLWLSEYCIQHNLSGMELAIERSLIHDFNDDITHYLMDDYPNGNSHQKKQFRLMKPHFVTLFKPFSFPIRHVTKPDMQQIAESKGWMSILNRTWFCFRPRKFDQPCGSCKPCLRAIQEGFDWRIPKHRIFTGRLRILYSHWRNINVNQHKDESTQES